MLKEFKAFIMKGNVLDLAVAVIIAGAFGAIVASLTNDVILPPIGMLLGGVDFSQLALTLQEAQVDPATGDVVKDAVQIRYGNFIQKILDFLIIAVAIFLLVRTYNKMQKKKEEAPAPPAPPAPSAEEKLLTEIRDLLKK